MRCARPGRARSRPRRRPGIRRRDRNQSGSSPDRRTAARFGRRSRARRRRPREPESSPRSRREPRRKAAGARPLRPRPRSSPHKPACSSLARAPARQRLALALVLLLAARHDDRNHAAVRLDDDRLAKARLFRKFQIPTTAFVHRLGVGERDPLDRAFADREAVVLLQLGARLREGLIGGEVDDGALQRPRTPERAHLRPEHEWTHPLRPEPILRLPNLYFAEFRMPAEFFSPWRCICGRWRISRSVASTRRSAQLRNASRPRRRVSSTIRSSAASASFNAPSSPSTARTIDDTRWRSSGCARNAAISASSLNSPTAIPRLPPNQSIRTYPASV